MLMRH